ncbi:dihydropteroate synthase [Frankia sp. CNm7]|uniref:Dihydropteroate synthase n=1 Tax=Frankia nepalensis TaxID=1836974 RepID=A0A937UTJ5_9ACTN|nr:dihydropteroate synthase [Frankia nepalensis]MBL7502093.1 dihydropteroate synthase [Frankia nepalensis]MBL7512674.1 dihydropteroate synthase [Frankia nepalensis]MBL7520860.1 dihydropteroate synthase [Frankia nepalensis]MBL7631335.1 dihydropteroate synthase [Frankia nepalensis]
MTGGQDVMARLLAAGPTRVMGIVNVTPDSFSDGGTYADPADAVRAGLRMVADGADLVDVGGESTRPGAARVDVAEERGRVLPVVAELAARGAAVSVDTTRAAVAEAALDAGAVLVNDVSAAAEPDLLALVAERDAYYVLMHSRGASVDMAKRAYYGDVVADVLAELGRRLDVVLAAGISPRRVIIDPGIGFAKRFEHNWSLLAHLDAFAALGRPLLVGTSRKSFLGALPAGPGRDPARLGEADPAGPAPRPVEEREDATQATTTLLAYQGVWCVRVHAVRPAVDAVRVVGAWVAAAERDLGPSRTGEALDSWPEGPAARGTGNAGLGHRARGA